MDGNAPERDPAEFKDRRSWLIAGGIVQIMLGLLSALMVPMVIIGILFSAHLEEAAGPHPAAQIPGMMFYLFAAVFFIWVGIGSIKARRWARKLTLVVSWLWFVSGVAALLFWTTSGAAFVAVMSETSGDMPDGMARVIMLMIFAVLVAFYLVLPGLFLILYSWKDVKATCELRDPETRWTDKVPLPVLTLSVCLGYGAVSALLSILYNVLPLFGRILTGVPAAVVMVILAAILAVLAVGTYRLRPSAWWGTLLLLVLGTASTVTTLKTFAIRDIYERMGFPELQLEMMEQLWSASRFTWWMVVFAAGSAGYLVYVKRHFTPAMQGSSSIRQ